ncbi:MAG: hypothetical protein AAF557_22125 [Pseudomonadota bacterium]
MRCGFVIISLILTLFAPQLAQARDVIDRCGQDGLGLPHCPVEELVDALDKLSAGDFFAFRQVGMESFAMLTVMRQLADALRWQEGDDTNCRPAEIVYSAGEIWFEWVRLPKGVTEDLTAEFQRYEMVLDQVAAGHDLGAC